MYIIIITNEFTAKHSTYSQPIYNSIAYPRSQAKPSQANFYHTYNIMHVLEMTFKTDIYMQTFAQTRREFKFEQSDEEEEVQKNRTK